MRLTLVVAAIATVTFVWAGRASLVLEASTRAKRLSNPFEGDQAARAAGAKLYTRECAACHGQKETMHRLSFRPKSVMHRLACCSGFCEMVPFIVVCLHSRICLTPKDGRLLPFSVGATVLNHDKKGGEAENRRGGQGRRP